MSVLQLRRFLRAIEQPTIDLFRPFVEPPKRWKTNESIIGHEIYLTNGLVYPVAV